MAISMKIRLLASACLAIAAVAWAQTSGSNPASAKPAVSGATPVQTAATERALVNQYCVVCHNEKMKAAGQAAAMALTLDNTDTANVAQDAAKWEKVVWKVRAGMMPPAGMPRPNAATFESMITYLEDELDKHAVANLPPPGLHRMNRVEYKNTIRDLLALDIDPSKYLPSDDSTRGFDNVAGALSLSPALLEGYTAAAGKLSRIALGDVKDPASVTFRVPSDTSQDYHIDGLPFGTRGGLIARYQFPADGDYVFKVFPINKGLMDNNQAFGDIGGEKLELLIDGERIHVYDWDKDVGRGAAIHSGTADVHVQVKAGPHTVGVTFLATQLAPQNDLDQHFLRDTIETGGLPGFRFYPHVGKVDVIGPYKAAGATDSPSRAKIFICHPANPGEETTCARQIVSNLARHAFRRPVTSQDTETLMSFYQLGRNQGNFDSGVEMALQRILADPEFVFRKETEPPSAKAGQKYRITDLELASRLSFFLWSSIPDDELITLASQNKLHEAPVLEKEVRRMLADPKSDSLVVNFAGQWLNIRALQVTEPVAALYPDFDDNLRAAMRKEMELFVGSVVHDDRSVIDLLNGNYTYVNERLAKHYGIPNIYGSNFRRIDLTPEFDMRRGLLGKGSVETVTAYPQRTSPTVRGERIMQMFLGVDPPSPPPNVPALVENAADAHGNAKPSVRQQMEMHRKVEPCATCHKIMDPIGFSLENFDAIGQWRTMDDGNPIDSSGRLVDGTQLNGVASLRDALVKYSPQFVRLITEKLMIYGLGRGTEYYDMPLMRSIVHEAAQNNYKFSSLVMGVVKSEAFQMNMKQAQNETRASR
jgi:mono/diheme cytochrome c family protein